MTVERNPNYYWGEPLLKEINYKIIPDENSALVALEAGEIDEAGIPAQGLYPDEVGQRDKCL